MKLLFVSPRGHTGGLESLRKGHQILQGLLFIAAAARDAGHKSTVVIADADSVDRYIRRYQPDLIGVSCVTSTYPVARELLIKLKREYPAIPTIIGGHHATFMYREVLEETGVTYICRGEGEEVFPALLSSIEAGEVYPAIPGIVFVKDGILHNEDHIAILEDLDHLPRITMDLTAPEFTFSPKIVSSRGCPFRCSFCSISAFYDGKYRQRKVLDVIADVEEYIRWGFDTFWFHDDNLTVDTAWVNDFCAEVEKRGLKFRWNCMTRVDSIVKDPKLFARMAKAGCSLVSIGIESGIPEVLKRMHKKIDIPQIKQAISTLNRLSISHNWYMILGSGDEFDQPKYIEQNIKFFSSLPFGYVLISILTPFPGTEVFAKLKAENRILHYNWEDFDITHCVYQPLGMSAKQMESYLPKAYMQIYLKKGWRMIPLFISSFRRKAIRPAMVTGAIKALLKTYVLRKTFYKSLEKR
ncbi:MAG: radical SAM protein [Candidatus Cloacimonadaceae bacterium]|nr:radical SAM protein [Candidatus Cloacimonadaceae bacterium]